MLDLLLMGQRGALLAPVLGIVQFPIMTDTGPLIPFFWIT